MVCSVAVFPEAVSFESCNPIEVLKGCIVIGLGLGGCAHRPKFMEWTAIDIRLFVGFLSFSVYKPL